MVQTCDNSPIFESPSYERAFKKSAKILGRHLRLLDIAFANPKRKLKIAKPSDVAPFGLPINFRKYRAYVRIHRKRNERWLDRD